MVISKSKNSNTDLMIESKDEKRERQHTADNCN